MVSSDACRALVAGDEQALDANDDAFSVLHAIVAIRLRRGLLTVVDATSLQRRARRPLLALARHHTRPTVAVVLDIDERLLQERNRGRPDRNLAPHVVRNHLAWLRRSLPTLAAEGFDQVAVLQSQAEVEAMSVQRQG